MLTSCIPGRVEGITGKPGVVGRIWPDGTFGFSYSQNARQEKLTDEERQTETLLVNNAHIIKKNGSVIAHDLVRKSSQGIGSSSAPKSHSEARRGEKGITSFGRKMVRSGATILQRRFGKERLGFLTLTVPALSDSDWVVLAQRWGEAVRVYMQWLKRYLARIGLSTLIVSVTEIQTQRSESLGYKPTYHLHVLFQAAIAGYRPAVQPLMCRLAWKRAWCGHLAGSYDWNSSENLKFIRKSASAYIAKYMSKGGECLSEVLAAGYEPPATWWNMSSEMRAEVKRYTLTGADAMTWLESQLPVSHPEDFTPNRTFAEFGASEIEIGEGVMRKVGYWGRLTSRGTLDIFGILDRRYWAA